MQLAMMWYTHLVRRVTKGYRPILLPKQIGSPFYGLNSVFIACLRFVFIKKSM